MLLYLPFQSVHYPVQVPKVYQDLYREKQVNVTRQKYLGMVTAMDDAVGNITQALKESGLYLRDNIVGSEWGFNVFPDRILKEVTVL